MTAARWVLRGAAGMTAGSSSLPRLATVDSGKSSNKDWFAMLDDGCKNVVGTRWVANKEPKFAILIVHTKGVTAKRKVDPHFGHVVRDVICNSGTG